jgi:hypothetical protein
VRIDDVTRYELSLNRSHNALVWCALGGTLLLVAISSHWPVRNGYFQVDDFLWLHIANWRNVLDSFTGSQGAHIAY